MCEGLMHELKIVTVLPQASRCFHPSAVNAPQPYGPPRATLKVGRLGDMPSP